MFGSSGSSAQDHCAPRRICGSSLANLDVHFRVAIAILRHAQFAITMEIYTEVSDQAARAGLKKLGDSLE